MKTINNIEKTQKLINQITELTGTIEKPKMDMDVVMAADKLIEELNDRI